jgi:enamine deaminase RidA (YjgF/YER057c/UK114 family)
MKQTAKRLAELGIALPKPAAPVANYVPALTAAVAPGASQLWISGQLPLGADGKLADRHKGKLEPGSSVDAAREAARLCAINILAQAEAALGDLDAIVQTIRLGGYFNVAGAFDPLPQAMNGASDLMVEVLGERGKHARTTVGVAHLPLNALAEVEAVFLVAM